MAIERTVTMDIVVDVTKIGSKLKYLLMTHSFIFSFVLVIKFDVVLEDFYFINRKLNDFANFIEGF